MGERKELREVLGSGSSVPLILPWSVAEEGGERNVRARNVPERKGQNN